MAGHQTLKPWGYGLDLLLVGPRTVGRLPRSNSGQPTVSPTWTTSRVILIVAIIAGHGIAGYSKLDFWPYSEMKEVELSLVTQTILYMVAGPFALLLIPMLFLVAGLLTPASLERRGPGPYARDRLVRLGLPFTVYVLLLQPLLMYPVHPPGETPVSYWTEFLGSEEQTLDTGPLWFVGVLLIFSLASAAWFHVRRGHAGQAGSSEIKAGHLLLLVTAVAIATFLVRLQVPFGGSNKLLSLNVWEWPACMTLFAIGINGFRRGWLTAVPDLLRRQCRNATLASFAAFVVFVGVADALAVTDEQMWGGGHWAALVWAAFESTLAVFGSVWLLGVAQRHLNGRFSWVGPTVSRSAYGAFMVQSLFLIGLAVALRPLPFPAEVKALIVAGGAVAGSFALAWLLISRLPGVARVL